MVAVSAENLILPVRLAPVATHSPTICAFGQIGLAGLSSW